MISQHLTKFKFAWQLSGLFYDGMKNNISHLSRKSHRVACSWTFDRNFQNLFQTKNMIRHHSRPFWEARHFFVERWTSLINSWILKSQKKKCLKSTAKSWPLHGQHEQVWLWNQHSLLGMGSCSILAIKIHNLFHIKITHIENCFCSVEQSLPRAKKAKSLAWPLAWLAILTKQNSLPNLWSWVWSTRTFRSSFCTSSH